LGGHERPEENVRPLFGFSPGIEAARIFKEASPRGGTVAGEVAVPLNATDLSRTRNA